MYKDEELEYGTISYSFAGFMGVAMSATHENGEHKLRFCENRQEVSYYQAILRDWLNGLNRDESKYHVGPWGVYYDDGNTLPVRERG